MRVFKIEDLDEGEFSDSSRPMFAVLGCPIAHSLSPAMQNAAFKDLSTRNPAYARARYFAFEVPPESLGSALSLLREKNFRGINLTIPHKVLAMGMVSDFDEEAKLAGACNTLMLHCGTWKAFNTDGFGLETAVEKSFGKRFYGAHIAILGAGGAARGAAFRACLQGCKSLKIFNRSPGRLEKLAGDLELHGFKTNIETFPIDCAETKIESSSIVVNATSIGLGESDNSILDFSKLPSDIVFFDMAYKRGGETASVRAARCAGISASGGLPMLAWQGAKSFSIWTGEVPPGELMLKTLIEIAK